MAKKVRYINVRFVVMSLLCFRAVMATWFAVGKTCSWSVKAKPKGFWAACRYSLNLIIPCSSLQGNHLFPLPWDGRGLGRGG
jgi:hypothetical protein